LYASLKEDEILHDVSVYNKYYINKVEMVGITPTYPTNNPSDHFSRDFPIQLHRQFIFSFKLRDQLKNTSLPSEWAY
jgi:hypothetical protein